MTLNGKSVDNSKDLQRILALPRRVWTPEDAEHFADELTALLRTPAGTMRLRPIQAIALMEIAQHGRMFGSIRVGGGKTLISLLAPVVLDSRRAVLITPAALREKTERERLELSKHWKVSRSMRVISYEELGRVAAATLLEFLNPDLFVFDECHRLKNLKAGVTRRVARFIDSHPQTRCVAMSGSILKSSIRDFAHILAWTHKDGAPIPLDYNELDDWANALDEGSNPLQRLGVGALAYLGGEGPNRLAAARDGFHRRLVETPGVVSTGSDHVDAGLYIRALEYTVSPVTEQNFEKLRTTWTTPDDWSLMEAVDVWRHAKELALGFHYVWDPRPPDNWLFPRKDWAKFVRQVLGRSHTLDTELQVAMACDEGKLDASFLNNWRKVRDTFKPNTKAVWHDDAAIKACEAWAKHGPGIIWTEHSFFGRELARRLKVPYFGRKGVDDVGNPIEQASGIVVASIRANSTGRNLQAWSRNLVTSAPTGGDEWEQLLGRTHRDGQRADTVEVDVLFSCLEHFNALERAIDRARATKELTGGEQKLLLADIVYPRIQDKKGWRWTKELDDV